VYDKNAFRNEHFYLRRACAPDQELIGSQSEKAKKVHVNLLSFPICNSLPVDSIHNEVLQKPAKSGGYLRY
jgi:hypothetical protein